MHYVTIHFEDLHSVDSLPHRICPEISVKRLSDMFFVHVQELSGWFCLMHLSMLGPRVGGGRPRGI